MSFEVPRSEQEVFADLDALCGSPGYIHVLAYLSFRDNMISYGDKMTVEDVAESYAPDRTIRTEFTTLMGLMLKHPISFNIPDPEIMQELIAKTTSLLAELHSCLGLPMLAVLQQAFVGQKSGYPAGDMESPFARGDVLREPIFYGGESAYNFQYLEFAVVRYAKDDEWFLSNKGFIISDAYAVAKALTQVQNRRLISTLAALRTLDPSQWSVLPGFQLSLAEIASEAALSLETASAVLSALTAPEAPANADFATLGDFNIANACPILRTESGDYISLQNYGVVESLYESPFYWMASDKAYKDIAFAHRGDFTEAFVVERVKAVFGAANVHRSVNIYSGGDRISEVDVLVLFSNRALVVQCKSKKMTLAARKGNDLQLRDDFKKSIQDSYDQAYLCSKSLKQQGLKFVDESGNAIAIPDLQEIYPICVVSDHYPALTVQAREFLSYQVDDEIQTPLVADVFLIDVLAEMLHTPLRFLSYINRRVNYGRRVNSTSELNILSYHLRSNLWIDDKTDMVMFADETSIDLDAAMMVRRGGAEGERTPRGILTRIDGTLVGRILRAIENSSDAGLVDLGFFLLTLSGDTLDDLNQRLREVSDAAKKDGESHDFTFCFEHSSAGLTVHCGPLPNDEALARLARHCERRKYLQRANSWFGLVVRMDDGLPKFGINLRFPWKEDVALDAATKNMAVAPVHNRGVRSSQAKRRKIGRNELCPCGSGAKYKRCCLR